MIKGNTCQIKGCCIYDKNYRFQSLTEKNKPDSIYPPLLYDVFHFIFYLPMYLCVLFQGIILHLAGRPKRPNWDLSVRITVCFLQSLRHTYESASLRTWRQMSKIPIMFVKKNKHLPSPFVAKPLGVLGILAEADSIEDGKRIINAQWLIAPKKHGMEEKVILYMHGGGYCMKDGSSSHYMPLKLVEKTKRNVFAFDYRLSPETRFPGALYDAIQAYFHLIEDYKISPKNIMFAGDSAGGSLCMCLLLYLRDHQYPLPETSVLMSPWLDISYEHNSWSEAKDMDYLPTKPHKINMNPALFYVGVNHYHKIKYHPYVSPLYTKHLNDLPPILIQSGGSEVMRDEIHCFMKNNSVCNTLIRHEEYLDMVHVFQVFNFTQSHMALVNIQHWLENDVKEYYKHQ